MRAALIAILLLITSCRSESPQRHILVGWRPVVSFSGRGDSQTESFNIDSGQWRIKWATKNEQPAGAGIFRVTVHSAVSGRPLMVAVDHSGTGHDIAYITEDPRLYHLVIDSRGVDWWVAIEESVVGYSVK